MENTSDHKINRNEETLSIIDGFGNTWTIASDFIKDFNGNNVTFYYNSKGKYNRAVEYPVKQSNNYVKNWAVYSITKGNYLPCRYIETESDCSEDTLTINDLCFSWGDGDFLGIYTRQNIKPDINDEFKKALNKVADQYDDNFIYKIVATILSAIDMGYTDWKRKDN